MAVPHQRLEHVASARSPYRVMLVDDSIIIRTMFRRFLQEQPGIHVVATAGDGQQALQALERIDVEVALLDLEMPSMDGLQALPRLLALAPDLRVITLGSPERAMAGLALSTLFQGASDVLAKPQTSTDLNADGFRRELVAKVRRWGAVARGATGQNPDWPPFRPLSVRSRRQSAPVLLRAPSTRPPEALAVLCGEGGPQELYRLFGRLVGARLGPVFVCQPLPSVFGSVLADHLGAIGARSAGLAGDGESVIPDHVHLVATEQSVTVWRDDDRDWMRVATDRSWGTRSPASTTLSSLAEVHGEALMLVVLSGARADGLDGVRAVVAAGGTVLVVDRDSSPVWTLPGSVAEAGLASAILSPAEIGQRLRAAFAADD